MPRLYVQRGFFRESLSRLATLVSDCTLGLRRFTMLSTSAWIDRTEDYQKLIQCQAKLQILINEASAALQVLNEAEKSYRDRCKRS